MRKAVSFYTDRRGRKRPITRGGGSGRARLETGYPHGHIRDSEVPELSRVPDPSEALRPWSGNPEEQEKEKQRTITLLRGLINASESSLKNTGSLRERATLMKLKRYFQQKLREYERYRVPHRNLHDGRGRNDRWIQGAISHPGRVREYVLREIGPEGFTERGTIKKSALEQARRLAEEHHNSGLVRAIDLAMRLRER